MGIFDAFLNGIGEIIGTSKRTKHSTRTDYNKVKEQLGNLFVFCVSAVNPNAIQKGIMGAQQKGDGSYWQHIGGGIKKENGKLEVIEAFANPRGVDYGNICNYLNDDYDMLIFNFDFLSPETQAAIWQRVRNYLGVKYDEAEILAHLLPKEFQDAINDKDKPVCSSLYSVAFHPYYPIVKKKVNPWMGAPGDIRDCCYPKREIRIIKSGWK